MSMPEVLLDNDLDSQFNMIVHLSDLHIRVLERHDEYRYMFDLCCANIRQLLEFRPGVCCLICITGDIFDNQRLEMKPETILLARHLFISLSALAPVVVIPGNHDLIEGNPNRLDQITPVVYGLTGVYYLVNTGVYRLGNLRLIVSSLRDGQFLTRSQVGEPISGISDIYLYHGSVGFSGHHDLSMSASTRCRGILEFAGFDRVLLGDIHEMKEVRPGMCYAGSLIQQSFGESVNHGFLVWLLGANDQIQPFQILLPNPCSFINLQVEGELVSCLGFDRPIPPKAKIRVCTSEVSRISAEHHARQWLKLQGWTGNIIRHKQLVETSALNEVDSQAPIVGQVPIQELIRGACASDLEFDLIWNLHRKYLALAKVIDESRLCPRWRPISLRWKGLAGYPNLGTWNSVNFDGGLMTISGANASGKSSIKHILTFAIFGETPTINLRSILNQQSQQGECEVVISFVGNEQRLLVVQRQVLLVGKRLVSKSFVSGIEGHGTKQYESLANQYLLEHLGSFENFEAISLNSRSIAWSNSRSAREEQDCLEDIFGVSGYDLVYEHARQDLQNLRNLVQQNQQNSKRIEQYAAAFRQKYNLEPGQDYSSSDQVELINSRLVEITAQRDQLIGKLSLLRGRLAEYRQDWLDWPKLAELPELPELPEMPESKISFNQLQTNLIEIDVEIRNLSPAALSNEPKPDNLPEDLLMIDLPYPDNWIIEGCRILGVSNAGLVGDEVVYPVQLDGLELDIDLNGLARLCQSIRELKDNTRVLAPEPPGWVMDEKRDFMAEYDSISRLFSAEICRSWNKLDGKIIDSSGLTQAVKYFGSESLSARLNRYRSVSLRLAGQSASCGITEVDQTMSELNLVKGQISRINGWLSSLADLDASVEILEAATLLEDHLMVNHILPKVNLGLSQPATDFSREYTHLYSAELPSFSNGPARIFAIEAGQISRACSLMVKLVEISKTSGWYEIMVRLAQGFSVGSSSLPQVLQNLERLETNLGQYAGKISAADLASSLSGPAATSVGDGNMPTGSLAASSTAISPVLVDLFGAGGRFLEANLGHACCELEELEQMINSSQDALVLERRHINLIGNILSGTNLSVIYRLYAAWKGSLEFQRQCRLVYGWLRELSVCYVRLRQIITEYHLGLYANYYWRQMLIKWKHQLLDQQSLLSCKTVDLESTRIRMLESNELEHQECTRQFNLLGAHFNWLEIWRRWTEFSVSLAQLEKNLVSLGRYREIFFIWNRVLVQNRALVVRKRERLLDKQRKWLGLYKALQVKDGQEVRDLESRVAEIERMINQTRLARDFELSKMADARQIGVMLSEYKLMQEETMKLVDQVSGLTKYIAMVGSGGTLRTLIMNQRLEAVAEICNLFCRRFCRVFIDMKYNDKTAAGKSRAKSVLTCSVGYAGESGASGTPITLSGYENFILQLSYNCALTQLNCGPTCVMLFLDESVDRLDEISMTERLGDIFSMAARYFSQIISISHRLTDVGDQHLSIKREGPNVRIITS